MTVGISRALLARLTAEAGAAPAREVCGLLWGDGATVAAAEGARNVAAVPETAFEIDPAALIGAHRRARAPGAPALIGCYHSHPGGRARPSGRDAAQAAADGWLWLILADGEASLWRAVATGAVHGRFDPVSLRILD